jgi:hypothetical protein
MPHCISWNQILVKTFITIEYGELKQRVIADDDDLAFFILDNKQWEKDDPIVVLAKEENDRQQMTILDGSMEPFGSWDCCGLRKNGEGD